MANRSTATSAPRNQSAIISVDMKDEQKKAIRRLVSLICLVHRTEQTDEMDAMYFLSLGDLNQEQLNRLPMLIVRETRFWPSPGQLRGLLGIPNSEERIAIEARAALRKVLAKLRPALRDPRELNRFVESSHALAADPITKTLELFGGGLIESGVDLLAEHPLLTTGEVREGRSFDLMTVERIERRWLSCWREVQNG